MTREAGAFRIDWSGPLTVLLRPLCPTPDPDGLPLPGVPTMNLLEGEEIRR